VTADSAFWIAAVRARETERGDRLFADPHARDLAGERGAAVMAASERAAGRENAFIPVRVRWFDDLIVSAAPQARQVVLLGAGLDSRAFRLDLPAVLDWYEIDSHEVLEAKNNVLADCVPRCRRHTVVGDVGGDWSSALLGAGFNPGARTLWVAEGLFFYLTEQAIAELLREAAQRCGPGSLFAADVTGTAGLDSPVMRPYREWCRRNGVPPPFGTDDPRALFAAGGWRSEQVTAPGAPDANYGRLPPRPSGLIPGSTHLATGRRC
jgi:methyltransferase (TIGR00027 family)